MTLLIMDFSENKELLSDIKNIFKGNSSFDRFHIPEIIYSQLKDVKIEFINGLLDTAGFPSPGGWLNRNGKNLYGRMRVYFQIVRNWHLPVEIDNFLRNEFNLPIQTIDWGHPNIRDANMKDYFNSRPTSWSREHQVKFFPEYYKIFKFRITSKQKLFEELIDHNIRAVFSKPEDWFPPNPITINKLKPYHFGENDLRIPVPARRHFDAFWQINAAMGCKFLKKTLSIVKNPEYYLLTGIDASGDLENTKKIFDAKRNELTKKILTSKKNISVPQNRLSVKIFRKNSEKDLYLPLSNYFKLYLTKKYKEGAEVFDTSSGNLNLFLTRKKKNEELLNTFDFCDQFRIRPDVVGFLPNSKSLVFVEAKITPLDMKALGQLLGYCYVAQPLEAFLVSTLPPSISLIKSLRARPDILHYGNGRKVRLGVWANDKMSLVEI